MINKKKKKTYEKNKLLHAYNNKINREHTAKPWPAVNARLHATTVVFGSIYHYNIVYTAPTNVTTIIIFNARAIYIQGVAPTIYFLRLGRKFRVFVANYVFEIDSKLLF